MHCHVLAHGDLGAMACIDVTNGDLIQSSVNREKFTCPGGYDWKIRCSLASMCCLQVIEHLSCS
jgi:hypothetical protein